MDLPNLTQALVAGRSLTPAEAASAAAAMVAADVTDAAKEAFLLALATRGETATEVTAFAQAYRGLARQIDFGDVPARAIDIVGTGGDRSGSFNISSASALIVAAAGVPVIKHGNRSITSKSGSADFLAALGVVLEADADQLRKALREANFCYLYAPAFHPAFKAILGVRKKIAESGTKTIFNVLGPLINPAQPAYMLVGVYDVRWVEPLAAALQELGVKRGLSPTPPRVVVWMKSRRLVRCACVVAGNWPTLTRRGCPVILGSRNARSPTCGAAARKRTL